MMEQPFYYMIFMAKTLQKFCVFVFLLVPLFVLGCASEPEVPEPEPEVDLFEDMHPEDRHVWLPPSKEALDERRLRQKWLDVAAADLERLFMSYADIFADEIILENLLRGSEAELLQFEAMLNQEQAGEEQRIRDAEQDLKAMQGAINEMDADLEGIRKDKAAQIAKDKKRQARKRARADDYRQAILLFRNGQYQKSIARFESLLGKKYPARLKDNILFGLASNHFKLKQYARSLAYLNEIIQKHHKGDKWLVSHAVSGMIYNLQGQSGKAISILESALQQNPNPKLKKMINRLLKVSREGSVDASS